MTREALLAAVLAERFPTAREVSLEAAASRRADAHRDGWWAELSHRLLADAIRRAA